MDAPHLPEPKPVAGWSFDGGMALLVERGPRWEEWFFSSEGVRVREAAPPRSWGPFYLLPMLVVLLGKVPPLLRWTLILVVGIVGLWGLWDPKARGVQSTLSMIAGFLTVSMFLRTTSVPRWHTLEHRSLHLLDMGLEGLGEEEVRKALRTLPSLHPNCGILFGTTSLVIGVVLNLFLPVTLAVVLALFVGELLWQRGLGSLFLPVQRLYLAEPRSQEVEVVAKGLLEARGKGLNPHRA